MSSYYFLLHKVLIPTFPTFWAVRYGPRNKQTKTPHFLVILLSCRPGVQRVLVVLVDNESVGDVDDMKKVEAAKALYAIDVSIIPVAIGSEADPPELEKITVNKSHLIEESKEISPDELARKIMEKSFGGKLSFFSSFSFENLTDFFRYLYLC